MRPFRLLTFLLLLVAASPTQGSAAGGGDDPRPLCRIDPATGRRMCCRVCSRGKACGNSCIAAWKTCHRGVGCACNAGDGGYSTSGTSSRSRPIIAPAPVGTTREVQRMLKQLGYYDGQIDGVNGSRTRSAIRSFQRDFGLEPVDGVAGTITRAHLRREVAARGE